MKSIISFILVVLLIVFVYNAFNKSWTLMVCETPHYSGGCDDNKYELKGYKSQRECMEKGIQLNNEAGFECGLNCKETDYGLSVCDEICNEKGCSD